MPHKNEYHISRAGPCSFNAGPSAWVVLRPCKLVRNNSMDEPFRPNPVLVKTHEAAKPGSNVACTSGPSKHTRQPNRQKCCLYHPPARQQTAGCRAATVSMITVCITLGSVRGLLGTAQNYPRKQQGDRLTNSSRGTGRRLNHQALAGHQRGICKATCIASKCTSMIAKCWQQVAFAEKCSE